MRGGRADVLVHRGRVLSRVALIGRLPARRSPTLSSGGASYAVSILWSRPLGVRAVTIGGTTPVDSRTIGTADCDSSDPETPDPETPPPPRLRDRARSAGPGRAALRQGQSRHRAGKPCVYVGMTGIDPDVRFDKHKAGIQANRYVQRF